MATGTITRNQNDWIFLGVYDVTTNEQQISIPNTTREILVVAGSKNQQQVFGGKSYVMPEYEASKNIIVTGELLSGTGNTLSDKGCYFYYSNNILTYRALDIVSNQSIILRVYYR